MMNKRRMERLEERWWKKEAWSNKCAAKDDGSGSITIENIGGVFIAIFLGIGFSLLTLLGEYHYFKKRREAELPSNRFLQNVVLGQDEIDLMEASGSGSVESPVKTNTNAPQNRFTN